MRKKLKQFQIIYYTKYINEIDNLGAEEDKRMSVWSTKIVSSV